MQAILTLSGIEQAYPGRGMVLDGTELRIEPGQKAGLIGHNGSGKTTLFQIAMGLLKPQAGVVRFKGKEVADEKGFTEVRRAVGLLFQNADDQLFCPTVIEDVAFGPLNLGKSPKEARAIAEATLARVGLPDYAERVTHKLSGGEKRLVALAAVLAMQPEALLLDEPTNDLDPNTRHRLVHILRDLPIGYTVISHDWDFLDETTDTLFQLKDGKIVERPKSALHMHPHIHAGGDVPHQHGDL